MLQIVDNKYWRLLVAGVFSCDKCDQNTKWTNVRQYTESQCQWYDNFAINNYDPLIEWMNERNSYDILYDKMNDER